MANNFDKHIRTTWLCYECNTEYEEVTLAKPGSAGRIIVVCSFCGRTSYIDVPMIGAVIINQTVLEDMITDG